MQEDQLKRRKATRAARQPAPPTPTAQATTQETTTKPATPIEVGSPVVPRKAAAPVAPERVVAPPKALPTRVHRQSPQPQPQPKVEPEKSAPKGWRAQWMRFRWLVALVALGSALAAQKMADDARVG